MATHLDTERADRSGTAEVARASIAALGWAHREGGEVVLFEGAPRRLHASWHERPRLPVRVERYLIPGAAPTVHLAGLVLDGGPLDCMFTAYDQPPIAVAALAPGQVRRTGAQILQAMPTNILGLIAQAFGYEGAGYHFSLGRLSRAGTMLAVLHAARRGRAALMISRPATCEAACIVCSGPRPAGSSPALVLDPESSLLDQLQAWTRQSLDTVGVNPRRDIRGLCVAVAR